MRSAQASCLCVCVCVRARARACVCGAGPCELRVRWPGPARPETQMGRKVNIRPGPAQPGPSHPGLAEKIGRAGRNSDGRAGALGFGGPDHESPATKTLPVDGFLMPTIFASLHALARQQHRYEGSGPRSCEGGV
jgi:hypothetical protein